ncbi:uncharacterized protein LOC117108685 [Anneissia japonica]|uniref:uncharacterized protein LOC117108685 n=1 Tax=Anneissia japonica TaxID=1529436 RepID=UPI001425A64D|nr:uncharacterized protein LOC117108685 [Anneissia japonica]
MCNVVLYAHLYIGLLFRIMYILGGISASNTSVVENCQAPNLFSQYFLNTHLQSSPAEFHCQFNWTNRDEMVKKVNDRIHNRQKVFLRFKVPLSYHDRESRTWKQAKNEFETWVWVAATHDYMLYFPHNFNVLSLGTMGIITNDFWEPDGEGDLLGTWTSDSCVELLNGTRRRSLTKYDMISFMSNVTKGKIEWDYVCRQLDYDVTDVILNPNSAIPDLFYYWRFLRQLFSRRPYFGKGLSKADFIHYNCYDKNRPGILKEKELLMNYYVILILAVILWLYSPLLVYYFPSSKPTVLIYPPNINSENFQPSHKSPVYFMNFVRCILCFYMEGNKAVKSRARRVVFFLCSFVILTRFYNTPHRVILIVFVIMVLISVSIPEVWSASLKNSQPTKFLDWWKYPEDVFRKNTRDKEYQFLAHCMKERVFLLTDLRFWTMLYSRSLALLCSWDEVTSNLPIGILKGVVSVFVCSFTFMSMLLLTLIYHFLPAFYFYKKISCAIFTATKLALSTNSYSINVLTSVLSFLFSVILVVYIIIASMFFSYLFVDVTMFIYFGAVMDPSMAFNYVSLVGAISLVLYNLFKDLRESYEKLRDQIVDILKGDEHLRHVRNDCGIISSDILERRDEADGVLKITLKVGPKPPEVILYHDHFATYLSRPLLKFCIEQCNPVRRQVFFIFVKVLVMTFYVCIAMYIKNVFHKEKEVKGIFGVAETIALYYAPTLLQFLAQRRRGEKDNVVRHLCVHKAVALYIKKLL